MTLKKIGLPLGVVWGGFSIFFKSVSVGVMSVLAGVGNFLMWWQKNGVSRGGLRHPEDSKKSYVEILMGWFGLGLGWFGVH